MGIKMVDRNGNRIRNRAMVKFFPTTLECKCLFDGKPIYGVAYQLPDGGFYISTDSRGVLVWENDGKPAYDVEVVRRSIMDCVRGAVSNFAGLLVGLRG